MAEGKRIKQRKRKRSINIGRVALTVLVIGLLVAIGLVIRNIISLSLEKRDLEKQNEELTEKRDDLTTELQNVNDQDYIEEQARKLLHMIKPGEVLYIISGNGNPRPGSEVEGDSEMALPTQPGGFSSAGQDDEPQQEESAQQEEVTEPDEEILEEEPVQEEDLNISDENYSEESGGDSESSPEGESSVDGGEPTYEDSDDGE